MKDINRCVPLAFGGVPGVLVRADLEDGLSGFGEAVGGGLEGGGAVNGWDNLAV